MTRFVTQQEPLISLSHRASLHAREHEDQARRTQLRKPITSVPLTGTGGGKAGKAHGKARSNFHTVDDFRSLESSWQQELLLDNKLGAMWFSL